MDGEHRYGGDHTERKVAILREYAEVYAKILSSNSGDRDPFTTWYFDAFAGSGDRLDQVLDGGLHEGRPVEQVERRFDGSARKVLGVEPGFNRYRLVERDPGLFSRLKCLEAEFPQKDIRCHLGDGNAYLREEFGRPPWTRRSKLDRALVFLDPYGMDVEWATMECLAKCQAADVWYFFNLGGLLRLLPHDADRLDAGKAASITAMFGNEDWRERFYRPSQQISLWDRLAEPGSMRSVDGAAVLTYAAERYSELFCYVSDPIQLDATGLGRHYVLFCMSNNQSAAATNAIKRIFQSVKRIGRSASHRTSDRAAVAR